MKPLSRKPAEAAAARMGALAKLPVFLDLDGKRAIVAGSGPGAAWKAELLAAAGADVEIFAAEPGEDMLALIDQGVSNGTLHLVRRSWRSDDVDGAAIAVGEMASDEEAASFREAARAAGALVNVIDKPAFCQLQFGSIVNRSPVVIGISTDGAAPILGQAVRQRIERVLPAALSAWGRLAKAVRANVNAKLPWGARRRAFWERLAESSFVRPAAEATAETAERLLRDVEADCSHFGGRVTLVGAGPGEADLLTLKAVRAMQSADVILFDDLVSADVLELARREAKRMLVGKRGRRPSCSQADINALMIKLAQQGKHVVRLKSGDPMIFGRAGEEIACLKAVGIPVTAVPGITTAMAAAAIMGVSLTHRDVARTVRFVTGHARNGELPSDVDWGGLADPTTTSIFYMSGRTANAISQRLVAVGLASATPAFVMANVSLPQQRSWRGPLGGLADGVDSLGTDGPILIGVGRVFSEAGDLSEADPALAGAAGA
jgi:uroporphyrin-III C-methyltransferase/precorrin-2 dehydrogenase/sirohydrochlorin ferrochelatase